VIGRPAIIVLVSVIVAIAAVVTVALVKPAWLPGPGTDGSARGAPAAQTAGGDSGAAGGGATSDLIVLKGSGDEAMLPFTVSAEKWPLHWSFTRGPGCCASPLFTAYVFREGEAEDHVAALVGASLGEPIYCDAGSGDYYLRVSTASVRSWWVAVEPA